MTIPHCPNTDCINFDAPEPKNWFWHHGKVFYKTSSESIQRYRCRACKVTFTERTFSIDYYAKKKIDYHSLMMQLVSGSGINDIGREMGITPNTVNNRLERLARTALSIHSQILQKLPLSENYVADGIESFSGSQFFPNNINLVVGVESEFVYLCGFANLRRKGCMTKAQKNKRNQLESIDKANPQAVENSMKSLFEYLLQLLKDKDIGQKKINTDEHKSYKRAFERIPDFEKHFYHNVTSSKVPRTCSNPLFAVNYLDRQIRKDVSDHVRETVQFAKNPAAMMIRMVIYLHYHNCRISRRVREYRKGNLETHAERAGISREELEYIIEHHFLRRAFLHKLELDDSALKTWKCEWTNPGRQPKSDKGKEKKIKVG